MIYIKRNKLMLYTELNFPLTKSGSKADDEHEFDRKSHCQFFTDATQIKMLLFPYSPKAGKFSGRCDGEKHKLCAHYIAVVPEHDWRSCSHPTLTWRMRGTYRWRGKVGHWCHKAPDLFPATQCVVRAAVWRTETMISSSLYKPRLSGRWGRRPVHHSLSTTGRAAFDWILMLFSSANGIVTQLNPLWDGSVQQTSVQQPRD